MEKAPITEITRPRRPMWQTAAIWFAGGLAITWLVAFFFDRRRGAERRQTAVDLTLAQARDMTEWSGGKMRDLRDIAQNQIAERKAGEEQDAGRAAP